ncbi:haloacid dehalogenase-like hydrolase [Solirubrobacter ginsenosidimutans]|uniref:Haloacid dehalogenase-like hydrolase n=1 Tax=Solirubrobacter ginsenosidimutans TaxID=490573 RepID=A0A9X3MRW2_9ACTN|nr:HAD family hydrolase [Solirubrobacter ginsenosidimutans]MDA0160055.1 haloacid dehalogenase-like hydrolase [Solirubrobacter ginsenosidimutans]
MTLESWNDGEARSAIIEFVERTVRDVPENERLAVFDNDGTLWVERPAYVQELFLKERLAKRPELMEHGLVQAVLALDADRTPEEFTGDVETWFAGAKHPRFDVPFAQLTYQPMLELLEYVRANGFHVFVVTGGGVEFVRAVGEALYGVAPNDVIGSAVQVSFERRDGRAVLVRQPAILGSPNEGAPKAVNIQTHIGRRPILAVGNSAGDREMLEYVHAGDRPSLCVVIDHDDEEREYAYDSVAVTNPDAEPILTTAEHFGWTVVSMQRDWSRVFA